MAATKTKLAYKFTNDTLFKLLFVRYPDLLKRLIAVVLRIPYDSITSFIITNPEMPPEVVGDKFCRLDVNMIVDGRRVDLEVQIQDEGDYPDRVLYYWARDFSTALTSGVNYSELPQTIIISIVDFVMFNCPEFHSEFQCLEVKRHDALSDKQCLHFFELPKIQDKDVTADDELML